jgi:quinol monooxygenase YgiN
LAKPLIFFDSSEIAIGKTEEVKAAMKELAAFVEEKEPGVISYNVFFNSERGTVTVVQAHPDSGSMERHMEMAAHLFRPLAGSLTMKQMDVYGRPSDRLLDLLREKAEMLGAPGVSVHEYHAGFNK